MISESNSIFDMAKRMLSNKTMSREAILNALESFGEEGTEALSWVKKHMFCRKCKSIKEVKDFPKETSHHCTDCRPESKVRVFCLFSEEQDVKIVAQAEKVGLSKHAWVHNLVLKNLD